MAQATKPNPAFATLDWTVAETMIALGEEPIAIGNVNSYNKWVVEPELSSSVQDLGIRLQPNPEQLSHLSHRLTSQSLQFINTSCRVVTIFA
ncbi:hypothetical protein [Pasteurella bettyae]|uniref:Uncharacterized protein n=1 Tax=Pasteurella bettyae CCUG 2042 TaxID=1095749 RepID=I3D6X7_9PAST|nr:hypothetical protein [Pasteurella bettyae]EIJ67470.1 hypothetical protein HMPREF1052_1957 [Pasteurella bettyae CCUG 2042]SUB21849.1 Iron(III)-hydroxamate-binding protein fhuD [Pasteurella bettyae]